MAHLHRGCNVHSMLVIVQMLPATGGLSPANLARAMLEVYTQVGWGSCCKLGTLSPCKGPGVLHLIVPSPAMR